MTGSSPKGSGSRGVAHMRPVPTAMLPKGGMIYAFLAAYTTLGAALVIVIGKMRRKRAAA